MVELAGMFCALCVTALTLVRRRQVGYVCALYTEASVLRGLVTGLVLGEVTGRLCRLLVWSTWLSGHLLQINC